MTQTTYIVNVFRNSKYDLEAAFSDLDKVTKFLAKAYQRSLDTDRKLLDYQVLKCEVQSDGPAADEGAVFSTMRVKPNYNVTVALEVFPQVAAQAAK